MKTKHRDIETNMSPEDQVKHLRMVIENLVEGVVEDCPLECRSKQLRAALNQAWVSMGYASNGDDDSDTDSESNSEGTP